MFTNKEHRFNRLKKCLGTIYVFATVLVTIVIIYLEYSVKRDVISISPFHDNDFQHLLNLTEFQFIINKNEKSCPRQGKNLLAIVIVTSYAGDVETRSAVRRAYPQSLLQKFLIRRVFLLSLIKDDKNVNKVSQNAIVDESERFGDIVQGNFYEDYRNLTYKHMMGLQWAAQFCSDAKFIIKMDHDIVVNYYKLYTTLKTLPLNEHLLAGYVMNNMKPVRDPINKWFVSEHEYVRQSYPNFLSGWLYITNPQTAAALYKTTPLVPYFWIDDLYVTGLLVEKLSIPFIKLNKIYTTHPEYLQCCIEKPKLSCDYVIGPTGGDNTLMLKFQKYSENCFYRLCVKRKEKNSLKNTCIAKWKEEPFGKGKPFINAITLKH